MRHCTLAVVMGVELFCGCRAATGPEASPDSGVVVNVVAHDVSPPLRELALLPRAHQRLDDAPEAEPVHRIPHPRMRSVVSPDPVIQRDFAPKQIGAPTVDFEGMGAGLAGFTAGGVPPDPDGDIGPDHYVEVVNVSLAVFSRTGSVVMGPVDTGTIWSGFPGACAQTNDGDATVRYDHLADRWVIAQFSIEGSNYQCVAVSTSPDPTGSYARYQFDLPALNDYPKVALWPDAYYFTFNMFPNNGGFDGGKVCAMDRTKMLAGAADATMQCFDSGPSYGGLLAADLDGKTLPPAGAPNPIVALDTESTLAYWQLHVDFTTPANSKFQGPTSIPIATYAALCGGDTCVPQPNGSSLDSLADRAMNRFVYRRFPDHESLLVSHSVTANNGGGVRWYELRSPSNPTVFQQGTFAPDSAYRWMPSVAMDASGDVAAIYTVASKSINPSIRYTARIPSDPPGTMGQGEGVIVAGAGSQSNVSRWGDYSSLNIDPVDDCTFWGVHEYKKEAGRSNWRTRIASFRLASCGSFSLAADDGETVAQGGTATYTIRTTTDAGSPQSLQLTAADLPAGVTAAIDPATITSGDTASITLTASSTATVGATHYTIAAMGATGSSMIDVSLTVTPTASAPDARTGPGEGGDAGTGGGYVTGGCCRASRGESPAAPIVLVLAVMLLRPRRRRSST
ncbi:MAG TPA: hypothetical protein VL463_12630 [Kofleriaceae bacterium]|nr:hypothetical protein [Kofleriaceae bacterium]